MDFRLSVCSATVFSSRKCKHGLTIADYALFEHTNFVCHVCFFFKDVDLSMRSLFFREQVHTCVMLRN